MTGKNLTSSAPQVSAQTRNVILLVSSLSNLITTFMMSGVNVALPTINEEFRPDAIVSGWIITSFVLSVAVFAVPFGRISDIIGIKKSYLGGLALFAVISFITVFSNSVVMLIICRVIQGLSSAVISNTSVAMIAAAYPGKERGRALGISIGSVYAGLSIGPFVGGLLIEQFGDWRSIFLTVAPVSLLLFMLLFWKVKEEWTGSRGEKFDYVGSVIYGLSLVALMYGFSELRNFYGVIITLAGIAGIFGFFQWESRNKSPILNVNLFRKNKPFVFSNLAALFNYSSVSAVTFFLSLYLQYLKGLSPQEAGLVLLAQPLVQTVVAPISGRLSEKIEPRMVASVGMAITCAGLITFGFLSRETPIIQIIITLVVLGAGFGVFASPNTNAIMSSVAPRFYTTASSVTSTMRTIGQTLSMGIAMIIMSLIIGRVNIAPENYSQLLNSAQITFFISAAVCFAGIFMSMARGNQKSSLETGTSSH